MSPVGEREEREREREREREGKREKKGKREKEEGDKKERARLGGPGLDWIGLLGKRRIY